MRSAVLGLRVVMLLGSAPDRPMPSRKGGGPNTLTMGRGRRRSFGVGEADSPYFAALAGSYLAREMKWVCFDGVIGTHLGAQPGTPGRAARSRLAHVTPAEPHPTPLHRCHGLTMAFAE